MKDIIGDFFCIYNLPVRANPCQHFLTKINKFVQTSLYNQLRLKFLIFYLWA